MSFFASLTKKQWTSLLILLFLDVVCFYGGLFPVVMYWAVNHNTPAPIEHASDLKIASRLDGTATPKDDSSAALPLRIAPTPAPSGTVVVLAATRTPTRKATLTRVPPSSTPRPTATVRPSPTPPPTATVPPTEIPVARYLESQALADLELDPRVSLTSQTSFFTSACFGPDANPLQNNDSMAPADWSRSPDRKCIFGFRTDPKTGLPTGHYSVAVGPDGEARFYVIPPEAFASDPTQVKQLSQMHLIVDPSQGCAELGSIGITADGTSYQCPACMFLKSGGMCLSKDGTKSLVLPKNSTFILDPDRTGGSIGFQGFPIMFFRRGFSVYFTGKSGYAPPRVYFESTVETLRPEVSAKTTADMSYAEIKGVASQFDTVASRSNILKTIAPFEYPARLTSVNPVRLSSKETATISFWAQPETVLSSIVWSIKPVNNIDTKTFLETNLCIDLNGERTCFTGVEDFAHCAFFEPCVTGFSSLVPTGSNTYIATRYFLPGAAPTIRDPNVRVQFQAPDVGTILEMSVQLRVRAVNQLLIPRK